MTHISEMPSSLARTTRAALASAGLGIDATVAWIVGNRRVGVKRVEAERSGRDIISTRLKRQDDRVPG
jgi:hypothetical protein